MIYLQNPPFFDCFEPIQHDSLPKLVMLTLQTLIKLSNIVFFINCNLRNSLLSRLFFFELEIYEWNLPNDQLTKT